MSTDTTLYAWAPTANASANGSSLAQLSGSTLSFTPTSSNGTQPTSSPLTGAFTSIPEPVVATRLTTRTEGARTGGHTFFVSETETDTLQFIFLVPLPPGQALEAQVLGKGSTTMIFRDGGATGTVFTTCVSSVSLFGKRLQN